MTKQRMMIVSSGGRTSGKSIRLQEMMLESMDEIFAQKPDARILVVKTNGQHEIIEGTTYEDVTPKVLSSGT